MTGASDASRWPPVITLADRDTWRDLRRTVETAWRRRGGRAYGHMPAIVVDGKAGPAYAFAVRPGGPAQESDPVVPSGLDVVVPVDWPADEDASVLGSLLADPTVCDRVVERHAVHGRDGRAVLGAVGLGKVDWLRGNLDVDPGEWDATAVTALRLLEVGALAEARADALFNIGSAVDRRPGRTMEQTEWAIDCLRRSHDLWTALGNDEGRVYAAENLAIALQSRRFGNLLAAAEEAVDLLTEAMEYHRTHSGGEVWAQSATNAAVTLLRLHRLRPQRGLAERAVSLCREALPLRSRTSDPLGWAITSANLALALTGATPTRERLADADAIYREVLPQLEAVGAVTVARQVRADRCRALMDLAAVLRDERLRAGLEAVVGPRVDGQPYDLMLVRMMDVNPMAFGLPEPVPDLRDLLTAPPSGDEADAIRRAARIAEAGVAEARASGDVERRSEFARILAIAADRLHDQTDEAARQLAAALALIDPRAAPKAALDTATDLANVYAALGRWPEARRAYDHCLDLRDRVLAHVCDRDTMLDHLGRYPGLWRYAAFSHLRDGDVVGAVEVLERTRMRSYGSHAPASLAEIGAAATPDCPLAYVLTAPAGSAVLVVHRDPADRVRVVVHESARTSAEFFAAYHQMTAPERGLLSSQRMGGHVAGAIDRTARLLGELLQPMVEALRQEGIGRVVLVPVGPTSLLPWSAAVVADPATGGTVVLGEVLVVSQAPSAAAARSSREAFGDDGGGGIAVFADPDRPDVSGLPGTRTEAAMIGSVFDGRATVYLGAAATRSALIRELPRRRVTHLACHGHNDWTEFASMRLLLSDGDVTVDDLRALPPLGSRLVFLSACQTGQADLRRLSDEAIGLPVPLLVAGAAAVVSTLWPVDDHVTALMVGRFYEEFARDADVAVALHRAQRWLRTLSRGDERRWCRHRDLGPPKEGPTPVGNGPVGLPYNHPYHWAGFVVHGA